ncbi:MAG: LysE family translocator [Mangrovibacterium sp.]
MTLALFWKGILAGLSVSIIIGPIGILIIQKTVTKDWLSGFMSGVGASLSDMIYAAIAALSLGFIINYVQDHRLMFDVLATFVLLALGLKIFLKNPIKDVGHFKQKGSSYLSDMLSTFMFTIPNPLVIFVMLAVFAKFHVEVESGNWSEMLTLLLGVLVGANSWWFTFTNVVSIFRNKFNLRVLWWFNKIAGTTIVAIALIGFTVTLLSDHLGVI